MKSVKTTDLLPFLSFYVFRDDSNIFLRPAKRFWSLSFVVDNMLHFFPSGKTIHIQGYENYALDILLKNNQIMEDDIVASKKEVPEIWYKDSDDKDHRYYVDIFIKSFNKFIEVKSTWTYKKNMEKVELTKNTVKEKGFLYECWVFDGKGNIVETIQ